MCGQWLYELKDKNFVAVKPSKQKISRTLQSDCDSVGYMEDMFQCDICYKQYSVVNIEEFLYHMGNVHLESEVDCCRDV